MVVKKHKVSPAVFNKMKGLILGHYTEPQNTKKSKVQSEMKQQCSSEDLEEFGPPYNVEESQQTDADVEVLEGVIYIYIISNTYISNNLPKIQFLGGTLNFPLPLIFTCL